MLMLACFINFCDDIFCIQDFGGDLEGRRPLGRPRRRWEDYMKMYLREVGWGNQLG
jgi:hypothetical protein